MQRPAASLPLRIWNSPYTFWLLMALPAMPMLSSLWDGNLRGVLHPSGEFSARFMILAMVLTPLVLLAPQVRAFRWLMARRRAIGVAAFFYGALHTLAYLMREGTLAKVLAELQQAGIWTGWVAFIIFIALAATSNETSLRWLGRSWKTLQRFVYPAAVLTLAHWLLVSHEIGGAIVHFAPLALLEVYRIGRNRKWWSFRFGGTQQPATSSA